SKLLRYILMASTWHTPTKPARTCVSSRRVRCTLCYRKFLMSCSWDGSQTVRSCWHRGLPLQQTGVCGLYPSWVATRGQLSDEGWSASVSPDGSQIVFLKGAAIAEAGQEIWLMRADGSDQRKLMSFPEGAFGSPVWSPDGRWIAYVKFRTGPDTEEGWIELFNLEHGTRRVVLSDPHVSVWGLIWLPDGRLVYVVYEPLPSHNSSNFWAARL